MTIPAPHVQMGFPAIAEGTTCIVLLLLYHILGGGARAIVDFARIISIFRWYFQVKMATINTVFGGCIELAFYPYVSSVMISKGA